MKKPLLIQLIDRKDVEQLESSIHQMRSAVNLADKFFGTPLIRALEVDDLRLVELLIRHGADPSQKVRGETPLGIAIAKENLNLVKCLLKAGANVDASSLNIQGPPLMYAVRSDNLLLLKLLVKAGANPNSFRAAFGCLADSNLGIGRTALMEAADKGNREMVSLLLDAGADPWLKGVENQTAYELNAKRSGRKDIAAVLSAWMAQHPATVTSPSTSKTLDLETPFASWEDARARLAKITGAKETPHPQARTIIRFPVTLELATMMVRQDSAKKSRFQALEIYRQALRAVQRLSVKLDAVWFVQFEPVLGAFLCGLANADKWKVLGVFKTACVNFGVTHAALLKFLKSLDAKQPFELIECDSTSLGGHFVGKVKNLEQIANLLFDFCPFVAEDDGGKVKRFAKTLARTGHFKIWWD